MTSKDICYICWECKFCAYSPEHAHEYTGVIISYSLSSFGGDGLIPNIRFILEKDPLRFNPDAGYNVNIHNDTCLAGATIHSYFF